MRLTILAVGRCRSAPLRDLYQTYADRLSQARGLGPLLLKEVEERRPLSGPTLRAREAELLLAALPAGAVLVALDERGRALSSADLAARLGQWRDEGLRDAVFVIGGADGLDDSVRRRADLVLAFGPMTWPHMLARVMLAEQLYRADSILSGHPYHRP